MAKEQDLPLNPLKISGLCGRLMCCLRYEFEAYKDFKSRAPRRNAIIETPQGLAKVIDMNTPREMITLQFEDGSRTEVPLSAMDCSCDKGCPCRVKAEALPAPEEPAFEPVVMRDSPRASGRPQSQRAAQPQGAQAAQSAQAAEEPRTERKRRRRGGQKKPAEGASPAQQQAAQPKQPKQNQPRQKGDAAAQPPAQGGEGTAENRPASSRRRRRRRPSGPSGKAE